jgi:hypothetical protein
VASEADELVVGRSFAPRLAWVCRRPCPSELLHLGSSRRLTRGSVPTALPSAYPRRPFLCPPSLLLCRRPRHADSRTKPSPYRHMTTAMATLTAIREEPTRSMPTALRRRQLSTYGCTDSIPSYADGLKPWRNCSLP